MPPAKRDFHAAEHWADLRRLMHKYADQPMDFADACVVKLTECGVWTTDTRDFKVYRRKERLQIPLIAPPAKT
jgi:predicted nucleic acid-binding protein